MPGSSDSVKVAVRVRPFNQREKNAGSKCILSMKDKSTTIKHPDTGETKTFAYDHSYWSHDRYTETSSGVYEPDTESSPYTDQKRLFRDLGQGVLDNAWQGYNAALFAYGQTGSGKSYSMIGYGPNKGIVPITCEELFKVIETNNDDKKQLRVFFSMLEIYNEQVRDLLVKGKPPHGGLKVRQNPKLGFYVEGLKQVPVRSYKEIEKLMESGTINRTTASTNMNATSSRSHMVITIRFEQVIISESGQSNTRSSDINLVDLAGSERADSTGATGDRLKEGSAINQSLSTLGNVISALADSAMGKKKVLVPYRDSVLTKLLQSALGGNSRTIMIAALSPADINYDETLSTMRYADRAKKIQNKAIVNESPTDRLIRELKEENARLMALLKKQGGGDTTGTEDIQNMLAENQRKMVDMQMSWQQRLEQARHEWERSHHLDTTEEDTDLQNHPYITNVNEDPQLSGVIKHAFCKQCTLIGRSGADQDEIQIRGLGIEPKHVEVFMDGDKTFISPCTETAAVYVNGIKVHEKTQLNHQDRLKFGSASLYLYIGYPKEREKDSTAHNFDYDFFVLELAEHEGVSVDIVTPRDTHHTGDLSNRVLFQDFVDLMPKLAEANAISDELQRVNPKPYKYGGSAYPSKQETETDHTIRILNKRNFKYAYILQPIMTDTLHGFENRILPQRENTKFEAVVKSEASHDPKGKATGKVVIIKVTNTHTKKVWVWSMSKFYNRKDLMDEMYIKWLDGDSVIMTRDKDPFWDPVEDIFLGSCHIMLQSIGYCAEIDEHFTIHNYHGKEEAVIHVQLLPCTENGHLVEDDIVLEPKDLLGKELNFLCSIPQCMSVRWINEDHTRGVECRFGMPFQKPAKTKAVWHKGYVEFEFKQTYKYKPVTQKILDYLHNNSLVIELWGKQVSEDEQLHSNGLLHSETESKGFFKHFMTKPKHTEVEQHNDELMILGTTDILTQLKLREDEVELLRDECDQIRKENFKLKQTLMRTEEKLKLVEFRGKRANSKERNAMSARKSSISSTAQAGLDVDFAKALRDFFVDMKDIQNGFKEMREFVSSAKDSSGTNGLRKSFETHETKISAIDVKMNECLAGLKKSATTALRKSRSATDK